MSGVGSSPRYTGRVPCPALPIPLHERVHIRYKGMAAASAHPVLDTDWRCHELAAIRFSLAPGLDPGATSVGLERQDRQLHPLRLPFLPPPLGRLCDPPQR